MLTPEEIAARVVNAFTGDEYWIDKPSSIDAVAAALRAYGDARAAEERERCVRYATAYLVRQSEAGAPISARSLADAMMGKE